MNRRRLLLLFAATGIVLLTVLAAACADDDENGEATSPAATRPAGAATEPATREPTEAAGQTPAAGGDEATTVDIAAENSEEFTESELTVPAGEVTIVFENREEGVIHNFALYDSPDSPENEIDSTELTAGPDTQQITVTLEPGEYYYNCQVHPNMEGTLTAE